MSQAKGNRFPKALSEGEGRLSRPQERVPAARATAGVGTGGPERHTENFQPHTVRPGWGRAHGRLLRSGETVCLYSRKFPLQLEKGRPSSRRSRGLIWFYPILLRGRGTSLRRSALLCTARKKLPRLQGGRGGLFSVPGLGWAGLGARE